MIEGLLTVLATADLEPDLRELRDALWLARHIAIAERTERAVPPPRESVAAQEPALPSPNAAAQESTAPANAPTGAELYAAGYWGGGSGFVRATPARSPGVPGLRRQLQLGRALKPFKRRVPSRTSFVVDEAATAARVAEEGIWLPVLRPAQARWLDLTLIVDTSPSMIVWQRTLAELRTLTERLGAFRVVRVLAVDCSTDPSKPLTFHPGPLTSGPTVGLEREPATLIDPARRQAILVVTDAVSGAWRDGRMDILLRRWGVATPVAVATVLPQRMWAGTGIRAVPAQLHAPTPGRANGTLRARARGVRGATTGAVPIPVMELSARWLAQWAHVVAGAPGWQNAALLASPAAVAAPAPGISGGGSAAEMVRRFRAAVSPTAFQLACYLSASWLNLPVMRLVQRVMLPESDTVHLAEVFLGGLLRAVSTGDGTVDPEIVQYDFLPGVRDDLNNYLLRDEMLDVLHGTSQFVTERFGQPLDFAALLADPEGTPLPAHAGAGRPPLAYVAATVLAKLGGRYRSLADRLTTAGPAMLGALPPSSVDLSTAGPAMPGALTPSPVDMPMRDSPGGNRFLLTAVMTRYPGDPEMDRPELADDVERIAGLFTTDFGYTHLPLPESPTHAQLRDGLRGFCKAPERDRDDFVAVYLACHGAILESDQFVLLPSDIDPSDLVPLAVTPQVLIDWLLGDTNVRRLLLMLDTSYSGQGGQDAARAVARWVNQLGAADPLEVMLVTATRPWQNAQPGVFSRSFERAVGSLAAGGYAQEDLSLDAVVGVINADPERPASQTVTFHLLGATGRPPAFLPNPRYRPRLIGLDLLDQERARHAEQREVHLRERFVPASRWFTGRHAALADLAKWLGNPSAAPALVVIGNAGSGKTALLGLLAVLSNPDRAPAVPRDGLPETFAISGSPIADAIYADTMTTGQVRDRIAATAGMRVETTQELIDGLNRRDAGPLVVLIDALDEAADPGGLIRELLSPLMTQCVGIFRLLLGTRPHLLTAGLLETPESGRYLLIDLDSARYADPAGIRTYVRRILLSDDPLDSPYQPSGLYRTAPSAVLDAVTEAIGEAAGASFLVARIIAISEAAATQLPNLNDPEWRTALLPTSAQQGIGRDLHVRLGQEADKAARLLLPLAYAQGSGLPWEDIWPRLADALTPGYDFGNEDLIWLHHQAGSYVIEALESDRSVYRLYHQALAEYLLEGRDRRADQQAITDVLVSLVPLSEGGARNWAVAHPYILTHLATHAAQAGRINDLLADPEYLLAAARPQLLAAVAATPMALTRMPTPDAAAIVSDMSTDSAVDALLQMPDVDTAKVLSRCAEHVAGEFVDGIAATQPKRAGKILQIVTADRAGRMLGYMSHRVAASILAAMPVGEAARILRECDVMTVGGALSEMPAQNAGPIVQAMGEDRAVDVLSQIAPVSVAAILNVVPHDLRRSLLQQFTPSFRDLIQGFT